MSAPMPQSPTPAPVFGLDEMSAKATASPWFIAKARREDGLAEIEDGRLQGLFPITGEWPEIEFIVALVNAYRSGALAPSDQTERERVIKECAPQPNGVRKGLRNLRLRLEAARQNREQEGDHEAVAWLTDGISAVVASLEIGGSANVFHAMWKEAEKEARALATAERSGAPASEWRPMSEQPDVGRKVIALYDDGGGAVMLWLHDEGMIDQERDEWAPWPPPGCDRWSYLPQSLDFICETGEEPMTLRLPAPPSPSSAGGRS